MRSRIVFAGLVILAAVAAGSAASGTRLQAPQPGARNASAALTAVAPPPATTSRHYIANLRGSIAPRRLGFNVFDVGPTKSIIDSLPWGVRAMVWLGEKCPTPADATFRAQVDQLAQDHKVYAYYLSDEPHVRDCPDGPAALASRASYIRQASAGRQKSFIVVYEPWEDAQAGYHDYYSFRPGVTRVDLVGIDAYPCSLGTCDFTKITAKVQQGRSSGIPLGAIVPVYQAFGQERASTGSYYTLPTSLQLRQILRTFARAVPHPAMDYAYGWGHQSMANPTLVDSPSLQLEFHRWFRG